MIRLVSEVNQLRRAFRLLNYFIIIIMDVYGNFNPHYVSEEARLDSFRDDWKYDHVSVEELALNGFFNKFKDDFVTCWFCNITIGKFEPNDVIREEHRKWSPDCALVRGDFIVNYPIDQKRWKALREENSLMYYRKKLSETRNNTFFNPFYEELSTVEKRLSTFTFWPSSFDAMTLAKAGLFYTNKSDNCKCKSDVSSLQYFFLPYFFVFKVFHVVGK